MVEEWGGVDQFMDDVLVHSTLHHSLAIQFLANCHCAMMDLVEQSVLELFEGLVNVEEGSEGGSTLIDPILVVE